jgi:hypothetical protein
MPKHPPGVYRAFSGIFGQPEVFIQIASQRDRLFRSLAAKKGLAQKDNLRSTPLDRGSQKAVVGQFETAFS